MWNPKNTTLTIKVKYDYDVTDAPSLASMMDKVLETALTILGKDTLEEYGNPEFGPFEIQFHVVDFNTDEKVVQLANGRTLRSGSETHEAGDYVRLCDEMGNELAYWDHLEWQEDPILVMGAILNSTDMEVEKDDQEPRKNKEVD